MNRIELRNQRKQWQRFLSPPFQLRQTGRNSGEKTPDVIQTYSTFLGGHLASEQNATLVNISGGSLKEGDEVLVFGDRVIGPARGSIIP